MTNHAVLIIDDQEADRYILTRYLERIDTISQIFEADDGTTALAFLKDYEHNATLYTDTFPPCLLFLDINMPILGGFPFLEEFQELQKQSGYKSIVVMMFTSSDNPKDLERAFAYPCVKGYVTKEDLSQEIIEESIQKALHS